ncbi:MAG: hypothetical protein MHPSP_001161 [Paramarteilia canceri]
MVAGEMPTASSSDFSNVASLNEYLEKLIKKFRDKIDLIKVYEKKITVLNKEIFSLKNENSDLKEIIEDHTIKIAISNQKDESDGNTTEDFNKSSTNCKENIPSDLLSPHRKSFNKSSISEVSNIM